MLSELLTNAHTHRDTLHPSVSLHCFMCPALAACSLCSIEGVPHVLHIGHISAKPLIVILNTDHNARRCALVYISGVSNSRAHLELARASFGDLKVKAQGVEVEDPEKERRLSCGIAQPAGVEEAPAHAHARGDRKGCASLEATHADPSRGTFKLSMSSSKI